MKNSAFDDFSEGVMETCYDFKTCQRSNGTTYGVPSSSDCAQKGAREVKPNQGGGGQSSLVSAQKKYDSAENRGANDWRVDKTHNHARADGWPKQFHQGYNNHMYNSGARDYHLDMAIDAYNAKDYESAKLLIDEARNRQNLMEAWRAPLHNSPVQGVAKAMRGFDRDRDHKSKVKQIGNMEKRINEKLGLQNSASTSKPASTSKKASSEGGGSFANTMAGMNALLGSPGVSGLLNASKAFDAGKITDTRQSATGGLGSRHEYDCLTGSATCTIYTKFPKSYKTTLSRGDVARIVKDPRLSSRF